MQPAGPAGYGVGMGFVKDASVQQPGRYAGRQLPTQDERLVIEGREDDPFRKSRLADRIQNGLFQPRISDDAVFQLDIEPHVFPPDKMQHIGQFRDGGATGKSSGNPRPY